MRKRHLYGLAILLPLLLLEACSSTRGLKENEYLLVKNEVHSNRKLEQQNDILYIIKPQANQQFLGMIPLRANIYQSSLPKEGKKDSRWRQWIRKNFGEEPVLLDSSAIEYSCRQIQQFLYNKGYFESEVESRTHLRKRKAKVSYHISAGTPYTLNEVRYQIPDQSIQELVLNDIQHSVLKKGMHFDADVFNQERERIARLMNDAGYYHFRTENVSFRIDSNLNSHRFNMTVLIQETGPGEKAYAFRKYYLDKVSIQVSLADNKTEGETQEYVEKRKKDSSVYFLSLSDGVHYRPQALTNSILLRSGGRYDASASKSTYSRLNDMQNFRFIRISYQETESSRNTASDSGWLDCNIQLTQWENNKLNLEVLGKDIGDDYGIGFNMNYRNRNSLRGGENFFANLLFSTEFQRSLQRNDKEEEVPIWNYRNFEIGGEIGMHFPKMLFPFGSYLFPKEFRSQTDLSVGSYFQQRDHYSRLINNANLEYKWKPSTSASHTLAIIDINMVKIYKDSIFGLNLNRYSQRIREKYTDHVLIGTNYKLLYNSLKSSKRHNFFLLRLNMNAYGNLMYGIFQMAGAEKNDKGQYTLFGTPFTGFVSGEMDFSYNIMLWKRSSIVAHSNIGIGTPTLNASALPFERSFYLGGSNSMRAWNLRSLGPGSYHGSFSNFESTGDIKLECNLEFRTPIYHNFYTACFLDAGNIWNMRANTEIPNGEFEWNRFYKEIALGGGIGIRWDISFLVLRLDAAVPIYTPYKEQNERWIDSKVNLKDIRFCFGIGYPF